MMRPPSALASARVTHYAIRHASVPFVQRGNLYVDGKLLGAVPCLAIAHDGDAYLLLHCTRHWTPRCAVSYPTVAAAKADAERRFPGLSKRWKRTGVTKRQAVAWSRRMWKALACSFCGRPPYEIAFMFERKRVRLCDLCVDQAAAHVRRFRRSREIWEAKRLERMRAQIAAHQRRTQTSGSGG
jgi:hypothetical protein